MEAHATLALIKVLRDWDWCAAEQEFNYTHELNPGYAVAHQWHAVFLRHMGRFVEALCEVDKAQALDPISPSIITTRALILHYGERHEDALMELERAFELESDYPIAHFARALVNTQLQRYEEAISSFKTVSEILGTETAEVATNLAYVYAQMGRTIEAKGVLKQLLRRAKSEYISTYFIATIYVGLNQIDSAFEFLGKADHARDIDLGKIKVDPCMMRLRVDPRFLSLLQLLNLDFAEPEL